MTLGLGLGSALACGSGTETADTRPGDPGLIGPETPGDIGEISPRDPGADETGPPDAEVQEDSGTDDTTSPDADASPTSDPGDEAGGDPSSGADDGLEELTDAHPEVVETCPTWSPPQVVGNLDDTDLVEVSGLAASRTHPGILWSHNDSGDSARIFAIRLPSPPTGAAPPAEASLTEVMAFPLQGIQVSDVEDIAIGPFAGIAGDALFLADTGNNGGGRTILSVYVFPEPAAIDGSPIEDIRRIDLTYPDGSHDCESLFVDPWTGDLYLVVKEYALDRTKVFRLAAQAADTPAIPTEAVTAELVADFPFATATAADMSPDGLLLAIRGYFDGRLFRRDPGRSVAEMLASDPCPLPAFMDDLYHEAQGEALAFDAAGTGFYTASERLLFPQDILYTAVP